MSQFNSWPEALPEFSRQKGLVGTATCPDDDVTARMHKLMEQLVPSQLHGHVGLEGERKAMLEHLGFSGVVSSTLR